MAILEHSGSSDLAISDAAAAVTYVTIVLDDTLDYSEEFHVPLSADVDASDTLSLSDNAIAQRVISASAVDDIGVSDDSSRNVVLGLSATDTLSLSDIGLTPSTTEVDATDTLTISDESESLVTRNASATDTLSLTDSGAGQRVISVSAEDTLTLTQKGVSPKEGSASHTIGISDTAGRVYGESHQITLTQTAVWSRGGGRDATDELDLTHSAAYTLIRPCTDESFSPFVGSSTAGGPTPPTTVAPVIERQGVDLAYPYASPTTTLSLRAPRFGNRDRLTAQRINRLTRGGSLKVFADPQWPNNHTLVMEFSALSESEVQDLLAFMRLSLGKEVLLTDHEGQDWRGIFTETDEPIVRNGRGCQNSASLVFEGEKV